MEEATEFIEEGMFEGSSTPRQDFMDEGHTAPE
jgi:hypothetical protein